MRIHHIGTWVAAIIFLGALGCQSRPKQTYPTLGFIERNSAQLDKLIARDAKIEILAEGFDWSEGPVWVKKGNYLLFSDVPKNVVHKWEEGKGVSEYLRPSGYTGEHARGGEPGSNGLTIDEDHLLVLAQHGDRRVARYKDKKFETIVDNWRDQKFNSPNDLVYNWSGDLFFTDPPYGLEKGMKDPKKQIPWQGVFVYTSHGELKMLTPELTRPNGIALSPDERTLYVAVSDPDRPEIWAFDVNPDGTLGNGRAFFNAKPLMSPDKKGLPDGLKVDNKGNLFATGPGGVLVISPEGKLLGTINTGQATANCAWGDDGSTLYITADMYLCRIQTKTSGRIPGGKYWPKNRFRLPKIFATKD